MTTSGTGERAPLLARVLTTGIGALAAWLMVMWAVEIIDTAVLSDDLQRNGIHPRRLDGLDGIMWAPFLHSTFGHLISNSIPFLALGFLVSLRGFRYFFLTTLLVMVLGGGLTWLIGGGGNHIGASGVVFGYFGALLGAAFYDRRPRGIAPALVALLLYSGMIVGVVPQEGISWEGHLFGLVAGVIAAKKLAKPRVARTASTDSAVYPWEADEPWLDS